MVLLVCFLWCLFLFFVGLELGQSVPRWLYSSPPRRELVYTGMENLSARFCSFCFQGSVILKDTAWALKQWNWIWFFPAQRYLFCGHSLCLIVKSESPDDTLLLSLSASFCILLSWFLLFTCKLVAIPLDPQSQEIQA